MLGISCRHFSFAEGWRNAGCAFFALPRTPSVIVVKDHWHEDDFPLAWDSFTLGNISISSLLYSWLKIFLQCWNKGTRAVQLTWEINTSSFLLNDAKMNWLRITENLQTEDPKCLFMSVVLAKHMKLG